jgi:hypothetical protein
MFSINQRILLFLFPCILSRLFLAYLANFLTGMFSLLLSFLLFIIGSGFLIIYFTGMRKTGLETGGKPIWWNNIRPIHGLFYICASLLLFYGHRCWSSKLLIIDTLFGLSAFLIYHIQNGNIVI